MCTCTCGALSHTLTHIHVYMRFGGCSSRGVLFLRGLGLQTTQQRNPPGGGIFFRSISYRTLTLTTHDFLQRIITCNTWTHYLYATNRSTGVEKEEERGRGQEEEEEEEEGEEKEVSVYICVPSTLALLRSSWFVDWLPLALLLGRYTHLRTHTHTHGRKQTRMHTHAHAHTHTL